MNFIYANQLDKSGDKLFGKHYIAAETYISC